MNAGVEFPSQKQLSGGVFFFSICCVMICLQRGHRHLKLSFLHVQTSLSKDKKMTQVLTVEDLKKKTSCFSACDINQVNGPIR